MLRKRTSYIISAVILATVILYFISGVSAAVTGIPRSGSTGGTSTIRTGSSIIYPSLLSVGTLKTKTAFVTASTSLLGQQFSAAGTGVVLRRTSCDGISNLCSVLFYQHYQGLDVFRAGAGVWFKDGQVAEVRSTLIPDISISILPSLTPPEVEDIILQDLKNKGFTQEPLPVQEATLVIYPDNNKVPRLAYRVDLEMMEIPPAIREPNVPFTQLSYLVDADTGEILETLENIHYKYYVGGKVTGDVYPGNPYSGSEERPFHNEIVMVDETSSETDSEGNYYAEASDDPRPLTSHLQSERLEVYNLVQDGAIYTDSVARSAPSWNWVDNDNSYSIVDDPFMVNQNLADVHEESNVYYHVDKAQTFFHGRYPFGDYRGPYNDDTVPTPSPMIATVQQTGICNAYANDQGLFFFGTPANGNCFASSLDPSVIYHEFTHRVVEFIYGEGYLPYWGMTGAMNEGFADYFSGTIRNDHQGLFFVLSSTGDPTRDMLNFLTYPLFYYTGNQDNGGVHFNAPIFSGMLWDIRTNLGSPAPLGYGHFIADELFLRTMELNAEREVNDITFTSFCEDILRTDDMKYGNNDPLDGTPHQAQICGGCINHGIIPDSCMICPTSSVDSDHDNWKDTCDNCPDDANGDQADLDRDGEGDACDECPTIADAVDSDHDGRGNACDNCPFLASENQNDEDGDEVGDLCDNCVSVGNPDQNDVDQDGTGSMCDDRTCWDQVDNEHCTPPDICKNGGGPEPFPCMCFDSGEGEGLIDGKDPSCQDKTCLLSDYTADPLEWGVWTWSYLPSEDQSNSPARIGCCAPNSCYSFSEGCVDYNNLPQNSKTSMCGDDNNWDICGPESNPNANKHPYDESDGGGWICTKDGWVKNIPTLNLPSGTQLKPDLRDQLRKLLPTQGTLPVEIEPTPEPPSPVDPELVGDGNGSYK